jgi:hypothetical protein
MVHQAVAEIEVHAVRLLGELAQLPVALPVSLGYRIDRRAAGPIAVLLALLCSASPAAFSAAARRFASPRA